MKPSDDVGPANDERTDLKVADHEQFFETLVLPSAPTKALRAAFWRHEEAMIWTDVDDPNCG